MQLNDSAKGALVFQNLTDEICDPLNGPMDLLRLVQKYLGVQIPKNITNVIIGNETPGQDQTNYLWIRRDASGEILGPYVFCEGAWNKLYAFAPNQIIRVWGDSRTVSEGFTLLTESGAPQTVKDAQAATWVRDSTDTYYISFDIVYTGCAG